MSTIVFELLHDDTRLPERATAHSAGYDLFAYLKGRTVTGFTEENRKYELNLLSSPGTSIVVPYRHRIMVPTGFKAQLPEAFEAQIRPRSGQALKQGQLIVNSPGTIDADFPHEWMVLVGNNSLEPIVIAHGDKIAQMVLARYEVLEFDTGTVGQTTERAGGFGSTGV